MHFADGSVEQYNDTPLKAGAQGAIYLSRDQRSVVKLYHKDPSNPAQERENRDRIDKLIARFNPTRQYPTGRSSLPGRRSALIGPAWATACGLSPGCEH